MEKHSKKFKYKGERKVCKLYIIVIFFRVNLHKRLIDRYKK
jgi:hypothetical protein